MKAEWLENVLNLVPSKLKKLEKSVQYLSAEMREGKMILIPDYHMSVKKAIVDFVLKDPREKSEYDNLVKGPEDFLTIRGSTATWQSSYRESKTKITSTIVVTSPNISELMQLWDKFKSTRLIEVETILTKNAPFELKTFKSFITQRLEKSHEKILTT
jgi:dynein heavy chain